MSSVTEARRAGGCLCGSIALLFSEIPRLQHGPRRPRPAVIPSPGAFAPSATAPTPRQPERGSQLPLN